MKSLSMRISKTASVRDILVFLTGVAASLIAFSWDMAVSPPYSLTAETCRVCFPPGCLKPMLNLIHQAKKNLTLQAYSFTSQPLAQALCKAYDRGVSVEVLVDKSQLTARSSQIRQLLNHGIPVAIDHTSGLAHNKIIVMDKTLVITGSYNFTEAAEKRNAENMVFINQPAIAQCYDKNFRRRYAKAKPLAARSKTQPQSPQLHTGPSFQDFSHQPSGAAL